MFRGDRMRRINLLNFTWLVMPVFLFAVSVISQVSCGGCSDDSSIRRSDYLHVESTETIMTGDEVFFDTQSLCFLKNPHSYSYEWDFGDYSMPVRKGRSMVHVFTRPGVYDVNLTVKDGKDIIAMAHDRVTVAGEYPRLHPRSAVSPVLYLPFENSLSDLSGNDVTCSWNEKQGLYNPGVQNRAVSTGGFSWITASDNLNLAGKSGLTVSLWARKDTAEGEGYLIRLPGIFAMNLRDRGNWLTTEVNTTQGNRTAEPWYMGANDTNWHHYVFVYDSSSIRVFFDDVEQVFGEKCPVTHSGSLVSANGSLFIGSGGDTSSQFSGCIDEVKIYDRALTPDEITTGFELWHADFHCRTAQYIYVKIPGDLRSDPSNRLLVSVTGDNNYTYTYPERTGLKPTETILLKNSDLPSGNYTFHAEVKSGSGTVLDKISERFSKPYDGIPAVGIDENNAMRIKGELFFPVTPFGLRNFEIDDWADAAYVNSLHSQGFWGTTGEPVYTVDGWHEYLDLGIAENMKAIGPGSWGVQGEEQDPGRNADITIIEDYVTRFREHDGMLAWCWRDEPELGGEDAYCPSEVVRSWTNRCHALDSQHPVYLNMVGNWIGDGREDWGWGQSGRYLYNHNKSRFGRRTCVSDILSMDYYPIEWAAPHTRGATMARLTVILDAMRERTGNLIPCMSCVETCDIAEPDGSVARPTPWHPTPGQLKMLAWINVVHGMKGITWFPWHAGTPEYNYPVMTEFVDQIMRLTPVVLGPEFNPAVTVNAGGVRIDTMVREYQGRTYLFAVRVDETDTGGDSIGSPVTATMSIEGIVTGSMDVFDESDGAASISGGVITDVFAPNDVHIYMIQ